MLIRNAGWRDIHNAMRKKIPESFSVRKIEHELSIKVVSVDLMSLQYVRVVLVRVLDNQVNIRTTIRVYSTKNPYKPTSISMLIKKVFMSLRYNVAIIFGSQLTPVIMS
jgi:uncharacterized membrane protein YqiK